VGHLSEYVDDAAARLELGPADDQFLIGVAQFGAGALVHRLLGA
jgi:hypothetical protein